MPGPTTPRPTDTPYTSFADIEQQVRLQELRESLRKLNVPDATAEQVIQRQLHQTSYAAVVIYQSITGTATTFTVSGRIFRDYREAGFGNYHFSFPPNDPKFLPEFVRALNYPHLMVSIYSSDIVAAGIIDWMQVYPGWMEPYMIGEYGEPVWHPYNFVQIDPAYNKVKIVT